MLRICLARGQLSVSFGISPGAERSFASRAPMCTVEWTKVSATYLGRCTQLESARRSEFYCVPAGANWQMTWADSRSIRKGDMIVAQTAFGHPAAFLMPHQSLMNRIFNPWGHIIQMTDNPDHRYRSQMARSWFVVTFLSILIGAFLGGILGWALERTNSDEPR